MLPIIALYCLIMYWFSELIVDKIHYGIFMVAVMILMLDNENNNKHTNCASS